ncbi:MAG: AraC family transcriptional regulator [Spirochaetaceae bacterium]|nr:MAG: AraC family transcriptional regulator [Spirochaetaceae bacterium]
MGAYTYPIVTENVKKLPFYLVGVGCDWEQEEIDRPLGYPTHQWIHCVKGTGSVTIGEDSHIVEAGQGILLFPGVRHRYHATDDRWIVHWLTFDGVHVDNVLKSIGLEESGIYWSSNSDLLESKIRLALSLVEANRSFAGIDCSALVYGFLLDLYKYTHRTADETLHLKQSRLDPVLAYIAEHYREPISIEDLAACIDITPQYLCQLFRELLHTRPFEYVNQFRLNKGKEILLTSPETRISEVARLAGYSSESYFGSIFRKHEGLSPSRFRKLHGIKDTPG